MQKKLYEVILMNGQTIQAVCTQEELDTLVAQRRVFQYFQQEVYIVHNGDLIEDCSNDWAKGV